MTSSTISLPSYRRQQLLLEFAALKRQCPEGIYVSPHPSDPSTWAGVLFVRDGPYASAVLRFDVVFPLDYPDTPPLVVFSSEIFHPLLVPLTTYTFAAGALDPSLTVSSADTAQLPPGSFNLREAFPSWYPTRPSKSSVRSSIGSAASTSNTNDGGADVRDSQESHSIVQVLEYMKRAFEDADLLDNLPLVNAGNPSAWHAWRAHRGLPKLGSRSISPASDQSGRPSLSPVRHPGDWNWEGVWESRVRNGIEESTSDAALYGTKAGRPAGSTHESIKFQRQDPERFQEAQHNINRMVGTATE